MKNKKIKFITRQALIASLYVVITIINPLSYGNIQFRVAEILVLLCFYKHDYIYGLTLGCFISNLFSPTMLYDITFGTLATLLSLLLIIKSKHIYIAWIWPVLVNALLVGLELYIALKLPFWLNVLEVGIGEFAVMIVGLILFLIIEKNDAIMNFIKNE